MIENTRVFRTAFIIIFTCIFLVIFFQNLLLSSSFELLSFRSIDDYAFQSVLRRYHERMLDLRFDSLFKLYDYGYGWIFWIINIIITFPFYIISLFYDESLLIVVPRLISQIFTFATAFILFKILKIYSKDEYIPYFGALLYLSFPFFAYTSMSFRTIAQINFFSALSFYYTVCPKEFSRFYIKRVSIVFAAAVGTKLSAALLSPLLVFIIFDRAGYKFKKEELLVYLYGLKIFLLYLVLFMNPSFFVAIFEPELFTEHAAVIMYYANHITTDYGGTSSLYSKIVQSYSTSYLSFPVLIITLFLLLFSALKKEKYQLHYIYILLFLLFSSIFLANHVKLGTSYITNYFSAYSFLLLVSLAFFKTFSTKIKISLLSVLIILNISMNYSHIKSGYLEHYNTVNSDRYALMKKSQYELKNIIPLNSDMNILYDHRGPMLYSDFREGVYARALFDNISEIQKTENKIFQIIILNKNSLAFSTEERFNRLINNADDSIAKRWTEDRRIVNDLINHNKFFDILYTKIYDKNNVVVFRIKR